MSAFIFEGLSRAFEVILAKIIKKSVIVTLKVMGNQEKIKKSDRKVTAWSKKSPDLKSESLDLLEKLCRA